MSADLEPVSTWEQQRADRQARAASYNYTCSSARACADLPPESRVTFAFGALTAAIEIDRDDLAVMSRELLIACASSAVPL